MLFKDKIQRNWVIGLSILTTVIVVSLLVYSKSLRKINTKKVRKNAVNQALEEFEAWGEGSIEEGDSRTMNRLRLYWKEGSLVDSSDNYYINTPWSGAFISYLMRKAGAENNFAYSSSHNTYIVQAIKNRKENNNNPIKGYKPHEVELEEGDLVCYPRQSGVTYDTTSYYTSHCDIVVNVDKKNNVAKSIGGNVSDSVSNTNVPITDDGKIDLNRTSKYLVVIKIGK